MKLPELLSPAGDEAALRAAVDSGADAVYLGYKAYGARASAVNFDDEALERAVRYAHLYHARVHVTVNTLVKQGETEGVFEALRAIDACGADAVIVQDAGVASIVRSHFPRLRMHASTQMAICNAEGAEMARSLGFDRVVLARECPLEEIRKVTETGIETEVFIHGALCTAVSGRCLMSSMSGGRSGNRGRCAQPCRQCFQAGAMDGPLLSLRDLCLIDDLPALCDADVASLKIEGRLKSPEYVAVVTSAYRKVLDEIARGERHEAHPKERHALLQIFNRGGFTRGHAMGAEDADLVTDERVSHEGLPMGTILSLRKNLAEMRVDRELHDGDSLQLRGQTDEEMRYSGHDVPSGGTAILRLRPGLQASPGTAVFRLTDARQLEEARAHQPKPIPIRMEASFVSGQPMLLTATDGEHSVTACGEIPQTAQNRAASVQDAAKQLEKLGGTPYIWENGFTAAEHIKLEDGLFLPVSALNALRRDVLEKLTEERIRAFSLSKAERLQRPGLCSGYQASVDTQTVAVVFSDSDLAAPLREAGANLLIWAPRVYTEQALKDGLRSLPDGCFLRIPPQLTQNMLLITHTLVSMFREKLGGVFAESLGHLHLQWPVSVLAGEGIPICNRHAMDALSQIGLSGFVLWPEWSFAEQKSLLPLKIPALLKMYGRETLMLLNHCPERARLGLKSHRELCALCPDEHMVCGMEEPEMTDRKKYAFPLQRTRFAEGCEISVLGALPTDLRSYDSQRRELGAGTLLHFTVETPQEQLALTEFYASLSAGAAPQPFGKPSTSGHWLHGAE